MNPRERILAMVLLGAVVLAGGGLIGYQFFVKPLRTRSARVAELQKGVDDKEQKLADLQARKAQVDRWQALSLPSNVIMAWGEYHKYLNELLAQSGFTPGTMSVKSPEPKVNAAAKGAGAKKQPYTSLSYELTGHGSLGSLVKLMDRFYRDPLLHQIKSLDIRKPQTPRQNPDDLDLTVKIEALIVEGAQNRATLMPKENVPEVRTLADTPDKPRRYADIAARNIFSAPAPLQDNKKWDDLNRYVRLTDITQNGSRIEASMYDVSSDRKTPLRAAAGYDQFPIVLDSQNNVVVKGSVLHIDGTNREMVFRVQLQANGPEKDMRRRSRERFYRVTPDELKKLVEAEAVSAEDGDSVFWVNKKHWEALQADGVVRIDGQTCIFLWDLVRGKVVRSDDTDVYLVVDKKFCAYTANGDPRNRPKQPHEGYYLMHVGGNLSETMRQPFPASKVEELKATAAMSPAAPDG